MHSTILFLRQMAVEDHVEDDAFPVAEIEFILNFQQSLLIFYRWVFCKRNATINYFQEMNLVKKFHFMS